MVLITNLCDGADSPVGVFADDLLFGLQTVAGNPPNDPCHCRNQHSQCSHRKPPGTATRPIERSTPFHPREQFGFAMMRLSQLQTTTGARIATGSQTWVCTDTMCDTRHLPKRLKRREWRQKTQPPIATPAEYLLRWESRRCLLPKTPASRNPRHGHGALSRDDFHVTYV